MNHSENVLEVDESLIKFQGARFNTGNGDDVNERVEKKIHLIKNMKM